MIRVREAEFEFHYRMVVRGQTRTQFVALSSRPKKYSLWAILTDKPNQTGNALAEAGRGRYDCWANQLPSVMLRSIRMA